MTNLFRRYGVFVALAVLGCGGDKVPSTVSVSGSVTYNGQPVEGAEVIFNNTDPKGMPASGMTDAQGKFTVKTYVSPQTQASGAVPGQYEVTVSKIDKGTMSSEEMMKASSGKKAVVGTKHLLPERYAFPKRTEFLVEVKSGSPPFDLTLKD